MLRDCLYLITHAFPNIMGYLQYDIGTKLVNTTVTGKLYVNATWRPLQLPQLASLMHQSPCQASSQQRTFSHMSDCFNTIVEQKNCKKVLHISVKHISCIYVANPNIQTLSRIQVSFWNQWIKDKICKHPWTWNYKLICKIEATCYNFTNMLLKRIVVRALKLGATMTQNAKQRQVNVS